MLIDKFTVFQTESSRCPPTTRYSEKLSGLHFWTRSSAKLSTSY